VKDSEWAYLAGIFDGEGCFLLNWYNQINEGLSCRPTIRVAMYKGEKKLLDELRSNFGGMVKIYPSSRNVAEWMLWSKENIRYVINGVIKYLRIKPRQAEVLLEAIAIMDKSINRFPRVRTRDEWLALAQLTDELTSLHGGDRRPRKWNYRAIKEHLDKTGVGSQERIAKGLHKFIDAGRATRFTRTPGTPK